MLRLEHISRSFPGVRALKNISLQFNAGEIHAICGENGAGKSTLMNIISGSMAADEGRFFWKGRSVTITSVAEAQNTGIAIVHQEHSLVEPVSVAENIFPVNQPRSRWGLIDYTALFARASALLVQLGMTKLSPKRTVDRLSAAEKQMVAIAKALAGEPELLILDEPTASLTIRETETLFAVLRALRSKGAAIVYISHRMAEIRQIADVVTVLKDGEYQGTFDAATTPIETIIRKMVGRELAQAAYRSDVTNEEMFRVDQLTGKGFANVSLSLLKGEIFGLAGLQDAGRTELAQVIFGDKKIVSGTITIRSTKIRPDHPSAAIEHKIAYIPEDRKSHGLFMNQTVSGNIVATQLTTGWYDKRRNKAISDRYRQLLDIKTVSVDQPVNTLSGGNQQKVVLAKWLNTDPGVFIINEPTHGVDVGAKADIYAQLKALTANGKSILLISSELPELLLLSDRIGVMYNGRLTKTLSRQEATEETITALASGV